MKLSFRNYFSFAALASLGACLIGCGELSHPGIETDRVVLHVDGDISGSISNEDLATVKDRMKQIIGEFSNRPQVLTHISWFAKDSGNFYNDASDPVNAGNAIDTALDREQVKDPNDKKAFIGTNLSAYIDGVTKEIADNKETGKPRLHIVFVVTDGGITEDTHKLQTAAARLAKTNVLFVIAGAKDSAGIRNGEVVNYKLKPLLDAKKLVVIHDEAYGNEYSNFLTRMKQVRKGA